MPAQLEDDGDGGFILRGELDVDSVTTLWRESAERFRGLNRLSVDLAGVQRSDSSGVALLVAWLRQARQQHQDLKFLHTPTQMRAIIRVAELDELLPLE